MKNMTKKIMALAMIVGFVNISAETFYPSLEGTGYWDENTNNAIIRDSLTNKMIKSYTDVTKIDKSNDSTYEKIGTLSKQTNHGHITQSSSSTNTKNLYGKPSNFIERTGTRSSRVGAPTGYVQNSALNLYLKDSIDTTYYVFVPIV
ncbi:hypothetical protein [Candidatus Chromulinivorax destructor]|uniref:Uncharacterized protein n=1 Tax=Candidatus Chromulinivorax destructor TaxID=2066483 RepID=A0A345ZCK9_9BACT|nr:hypothetical protein [Candidatus Chromulinivorax destructor]AXK61026.1 hypothetical protein C0J27_04825 [Candidatus Chromulinivorax destructor]